MCKKPDYYLAFFVPAIMLVRACRLYICSMAYWVGVYLVVMQGAFAKSLGTKKAQVTCISLGFFTA